MKRTIRVFSLLLAAVMLLSAQALATHGVAPPAHRVIKPDTHADDAEAVQLFNEYVEQYELLRQQMADGGFALTQTEAAMCGRYTWLDDPWPWDAETEA